MIAVKQHKPDRSVGLVYDEIKRSCREERGHFSLDITSILEAEEVMGRVHCSPPNFHDARAVCWC